MKMSRRDKILVANWPNPGKNPVGMKYEILNLMANTYTQIFIQFVFASKYRAALIDPTWEDELYKYITGIVRNHKHKMLAINGMPDHVHLLVGFHTTQSISEFMQDVKAYSSKWINERKFVKSRFEWQEGYGGLPILRAYSTMKAVGLILPIFRAYGTMIAVGLTRSTNIWCLRHYYSGRVDTFYQYFVPTAFSPGFPSFDSANNICPRRLMVVWFNVSTEITSLRQHKS